MLKCNVYHCNSWKTLYLYKEHTAHSYLNLHMVLKWTWGDSSALRRGVLTAGDLFGTFAPCLRVGPSSHYGSSQACTSDIVDQCGCWPEQASEAQEGNVDFVGTPPVPHPLPSLSHPSPIHLLPILLMLLWHIIRVFIFVKNAQKQKTPPFDVKVSDKTLPLGVYFPEINFQVIL